MLTDLLLILLGLGLLVAGGDALVKGAVAIAERARLSHMVIGLTIVAFGTSAPELLVSLTSALEGTGGIALGNVVGSNIANIALILGATALIKAAPTSPQTLRTDMPVLFVASALLAAAVWTGTVGRWHGACGFLLLVAFTAWQVRHGRQQAPAGSRPPVPVEAAPSEVGTPAPAEAGAPEAGTDTEASALDRLLRRHVWLAGLTCPAALAALAYGAGWLVDGASDMALRLGVSDRIVGLTVVAFGTSLPELFASIMAARRGETDMAIGGIVGSNLFNILCVLGLTAAVAPIAGIGHDFRRDLGWMIGLTALLWLFLFTKRRLSRGEGAALLGLYLVYIWILVRPA